MGNDVSDASLISESIRNPERFGSLFARHFGDIERYLQRRLGDDLAEELAAETFVIAFGLRRRYDLTRPNARPWLFGIAANLTRHQRRAEQRQLRAYARTGVDPIADETAAIDARLDARNTGRALAKSLATLAERDRAALLLYAWGELSYEEIAEALEIPIGTVRSRISRARGQLRELLSSNGQELDAKPQGAWNG